MWRLVLALPALLAATDKYGGDTRVQLHASGYFRVAETRGRWFLVTPEGHPYFAIGGNHTGAHLRTGKVSASQLLPAIRAAGFNAGDAYQPAAEYAEQLPWIHPIPNYGTANPDLLDDGELERIGEHVRRQAAVVRDNRWVIGVAGPDLPVWNSKRVDRYRGHPRYVAFVRERYGTIAGFNEKHGTKFRAFESIEGPLESPDDGAFAAILADRLYRTFRDAVRAGAPNHLFLGERTYLRSVPAEVLEVMGRYVDVFCSQAVILSPQRPPEWQTFQAEGWRREFERVGKPMILVDWAAPFSLKETFDAPQGTIKNEREASRDAASFLADAVRQPYLVGVFVCQLIGTHPNDTRFFQERARRAYLREDGRPHATRTRVFRDAARRALRRVYGTL